MIELVRIDCPWCGTAFDTKVDCSAGSQQYTEDCHVCCQPIDFQVEIGPQFQLTHISVQRENE